MRHYFERFGNSSLMSTLREDSGAGVHLVHLFEKKSKTTLHPKAISLNK